MNGHHNYIVAAITILVGLLSAPAESADCRQERRMAFTHNADRWIAFTLHSQTCLGRDRDSATWVGKIGKALRAVPAASEINGDLVATKLATIVHEQIRPQMTHLAVRETAKTQFNTAIDATHEYLRNGGPSSGSGVITTGHWQLPGGTLSSVPAVNLKKSITENCPKIKAVPASGSACAKTITNAENIMRLATLMERVMTKYHHRMLGAYRDRYTKRKKQWDSYRDEARPQYQWEWMINSLRMALGDKRPLDDKGQPMGPQTIPTDQLIVLHPGVGVENLTASGANSDTSGTVYLEWIGYNRWRWHGVSGKMTNGMGLSLVSSYAQRGQVGDMSHGIMLHYQNSYSLAITRGQNGSGILFSVNLAEWYRNKMKYFDEVASYW